MSATYDPMTGRVTLGGATTTWSRTKNLLPTPPAGASSAIYVMRYWLDEMTANSEDLFSGFTHDNAQHIGFNFNIDHPTGPTETGVTTSTGGFRDVYKDFFGLLQYPVTGSGTSYATLNTVDSSSLEEKYAVFSDDEADITAEAVHQGNGTTDYHKSSIGDHTTSKSIIELPFSIPINEVTGLTATFVWQVWSNELDNGVNARCFVNTDSIDLDAIDLTSDLDPTNPEGLFPVSNGWTSGDFELNGTSEVGTNWRPSAGVMAFPQYFNARYAHDNYGLIIDYLGVQYANLYNL